MNLSVSGSNASFAKLLSHSISHEELQTARQYCLEHNWLMPQALQKIRNCSNSDLMSALEAGFGHPVWSLMDLQSAQPVFSLLNYPQCLERQLMLVRTASLPFDVLVLTDPFDTLHQQWACHHLAQHSSRLLKMVMVHVQDFQTYLQQQEQRLRALDEGVPSNIPAFLDEIQDTSLVINLSTINQETNSVVKLVNSTLYDALKLQASDIHLECDEHGLRILYRLDGVLIPITRLADLDKAAQVISRLKVMAELDIAERRIPQDGRFRVKVNQRLIDFRVSIMPNIFGEDAVLRLLDRQSLTQNAQKLTLEHLGFDAVHIQSIRKLAQKPHGMLLVTGPTGSGKTTTLYAALTETHTVHEKVITIEDPVEYRLPQVLQIPVNEKKGLTFAKGLRSILRHDPDKIMVGEIRDSETAQIAVQASLTGHLVLTTVHANHVFDVLGRFLHMGVDPYSFASALNGIVAQRLLRLNCTQCSESSTAQTAALEALHLTNTQVKYWNFKSGQGCSHCRGVGFKSRKAVAEVLLIDDTLRDMIASRAPVSQFKELALQKGLQPLREVALQCVARGETTLEEVMRVTG